MREDICGASTPAWGSDGEMVCWRALGHDGAHIDGLTGAEWGGTWDPLADRIPEDQTRLDDDGLTLHELARAAAAAQGIALPPIQHVPPRPGFWRRVLGRRKRIT